jgi:hypothetical protein
MKIFRWNKLHCRSRWPSGLRRSSVAIFLLALWIRSRRRYNCLSVVNVCCKVETSATGRSLLQRNPTWYVCLIVCDLEPHQ